MEPYSIIKIFTQHCEKRPDKTAFIDAKTGQTITYRDVDRFSGRVYRYLFEHGIGKEDIVMIVLPRGIRPFVCALGVWKAGAAYVMVEADYPKEKQEFIKKDSGCRLVVDLEVFEEMMKLESLLGYQITDSHDLAFLVYTSGTTGNPKGVMHEYGTIEMAIKSAGYQNVPTTSSDDRLLLISPLNFVATTMQLLLIVAYGASMVVMPLSEVRNIDILLSVIREYQVTTGFFSPSLLRLIPKFPECVRNILTGSEPAKGIYYDNINMYAKYAQSESAISVLAFHIDQMYDNPPSGRPELSSIELSLMDDDGNPVADGEIGELCYKQPYLRGYVNLPEKTNALFRNGYVRSGDLGRILPDGNFQIVGRKDDMVKINGNRVEPGEIELAVKKTLKTEWVGVRVFTDSGRSFVCAYYIGEPAISIDEAKKVMRTKLASYMLPAFYIQIDKVPVSPNGKFRRNDLPAPDFSSYQREYVEPSSELEKELCTMMASVLELNRVGATDDFYEIGGDSIRTIQIVTKMDKELLDANMFLIGRTARKIAELYEKAENEAGKESLKAKNIRLSEKDFPLSNEQTFMFDYQCYYPKSTLWNIPLLLKFDNDTDMNRLKMAVDTVLKAHPVFAIVYMFNENTELVQRYDPDKFFDTEIEELSEAEFINESEKLMQPFKILNNPMYRIRLIKTECGGYLFIDLHHSIADGTSVHVLIRDICSAYDNLPIAYDYYFATLEEQRREKYSALYEDAKEYYKKTMGDTEWDSYLKPDNKTKENIYANMSTMIPLNTNSYNSLYKKYGISKNVFYIAVAATAIAAYNKSNNIRISWVHNGRDKVSARNVVGALLREHYVGVHFTEQMTIKALFEMVSEQVNKNILYSCYPYFVEDNNEEDYDDAELIYQSDLRSVCSVGSLQFTIAELPNKTDAADNLLDIEIHETEKGCKLYMDYNAAAYNEESIFRFRKIFLKLACLFAEPEKTPEDKVEDLIKMAI